MTSPWIGWRGGLCPLARGHEYETRHRDGSVTKSRFVRGREDWKHTGAPSDIVEFKVLALTLSAGDWLQAETLRNLKERQELLRTALRTAIFEIERRGDEKKLCASLRAALVPPGTP